MTDAVSLYDIIYLNLVTVWVCDRYSEWMIAKWLSNKSTFISEQYITDYKLRKTCFFKLKLFRSQNDVCKLLECVWGVKCFGSFPLIKKVFFLFSIQ